VVNSLWQIYVPLSDRNYLQIHTAKEVNSLIFTVSTYELIKACMSDLPVVCKNDVSAAEAALDEL